jgi:hypothetical protein
MASSCFFIASRTAPSSPMAPNSPVGQATVKKGRVEVPPAIACAPRP